jgi:hypothetical protein
MSNSKGLLEKSKKTSTLHFLGKQNTCKTLLLYMEALLELKTGGLALQT